MADNDQNKKEIELEKKLKELEIQEIEERTKELAKELQLPYLDLTPIPIEKEALFLIESDEAESAQAAVIERIGKNLKIVVLDPRNQKTGLFLKKLKEKGFNLKVYIVSQRSLNKALAHYKEKMEIRALELGVIKIHEETIKELQEKIKDISHLKELINVITTTELVELLLAGGLKVNSSDIHLEPEEKNIRLRYRIDGFLHDISNFDKEKYPQILNRIKLMSGLKLNIHDAPQDGRFTISEKDVDIEVRVSVLPGAYGEGIVMRLLDPRTIKQNLEDLGLRPDLLEEVKNQLNKPNGAIITTGPTGSGKTTTLYAFLRYENEPGVKIITIEDPIEYHIEGITQTQVEPEKGYTFANGLRSIVRQDPDVILVGEIRDIETAEIAMHAALTGHLVFSTLHTNDAAGTIPRLLDLGVKPQIIAPAINMAMAQRLVRRLCQECKKKEKITKEELAKLNRVLGNLTEFKNKINPELEIYKKQGCEKCNFTGYQGRIAVFEAFVIDRDIERLILKSPSITEIRDLAIQKGMITLLQDGYLKILEGVTDFEEVERIIGEG